MTAILDKSYSELREDRISFSREISLVLACSRTKVDKETAARIKSLVETAKIDWQKLIKFAAANGLLPLVFQNLSRICPDSIPTEINNYLKQSFQQNAGRNLLFTAELLKVLTNFSAENIEAIPFKGAALAVSAYNNLALRNFSDLDILVKQKDLPQAQKILENAGYQLADQFAEIENKPYVKYGVFNESIRNQKDYTYVNFKTRVVIELHWSLSEIGFPLALKTDSLWRNTSSIILAGKEIPQFEVETMLVYLCFHSSKHHWEELRWLCDVAEFIRANPNLNWQLVRQKAREYGCDRMVNLGLILAYELLDLELPSSVLIEVKEDSNAIALARELQEIIFAEDANQKHSYLLECQLLIKYRERFSDRLRCFSHIAFTPTFREWQMIQLPQYVSFLYYLIRPYRLLLAYLGLVEEPEYN